MDKKLFKILIFFFTLSIFSRISNAQTYEHIKDFSSFIVINSNGTVDVEETIIYYFPNLRHGIIRDIPLTKENQDGKSFKMISSNITVTDSEGEPYKFQDNSNSKEISLKIGDPDKTITGTHTYVIKYTLSGAITYFSEHDELYWNVTGNDWEIPILYSAAVVHLPRSVDSGIRSNCFTGGYGETQSLCSTEKVANTVQILSDGMLDEYEGLTVTVGFPKGVVVVLEPLPDHSDFWEKVAKAALLIGSALYYTVIPIFILVKALKKIKKQPEEKRVVAAWFDPPKTPSGRDLTAGEVGILHDKKGDVRDITATLIQLAQKGYIRIKSDDKSKILKKPKFTIVKTKEWTDDSLLEYEKYLLESIFLAKDQVNDEVKLSDLGKRTGFARKLQKTYKEITKQLLSDKMFEEDPYKVKDKWSAVMLLGFFIFNPLLLIAAFVASKSAKRTPAGGSAWAVIESMRNFVKSQEKQLEFQAKNQMFFEKLLPFAIALGVEKIWIERFKDIGLTQPGWLETKDFTAFSYMYLMSNFNSSVSSAVSMSSSRSSSGFSSGFSGGGFSGGGGGGGGGGSW